MTTRLSMTHHSRGRLNGNRLLKFPAPYDNKYVIFYSLWPCYFIPSLNLVAYRHMFCFVILFIIMAGFGFDDDDFFLSGLMQEGHDSVTVINSSSSDDENYDGLLECAHQVAGETSNKSSMEGGMQPGVEPGVSNIPISKMSDSGLFLSNDKASSLSQSEQSNDVSFSHFNVSKCLKYVCKVWLKLLFFAGFLATYFFFVMLLSCD